MKFKQFLHGYYIYTSVISGREVSPNSAEGVTVKLVVEGGSYRERDYRT